MSTLREELEALLASGPDTWEGYDTRDIGHAFLADAVTDWTADLRAILAAHDDRKPCRGSNANVCVAEGCFGEACLTVNDDPPAPVGVERVEWEYCGMTRERTGRRRTITSYGSTSHHYVVPGHGG